MKCCSAKKRYSLVILRPTSNEERKLFWEFRCDDIVEMFDFKCIFNVLLFLGFLIDYSNEYKTEDMRYRLARRIVNLLLYLMVWLIARKFRRRFIYWIPTLLIFTRFIAMIAA